MHTHGRRRPLARNIFFPMVLGAEFLFGSMASAMPVAPVLVDNTALLAPAPQTNRSLNWAGYVADGANITSVSGTWVVPPVDSENRLAADATWVGVGGIKNLNLIQAGTQAVVDPSGGVQYQAWVEGLPNESKPVALAVNPGDTMSATISEESAGLWRISLRNLTTGKSYEMHMPYDSTHASAEWIQEKPMGNVSIALDEFHHADFLSASMVQQGVAMTPLEAHAHALTMVNAAGEVIAVPSMLDEHGSAFRVDRTDASSSGAGKTFEEDMAKKAH